MLKEFTLEWWKELSGGETDIDDNICECKIWTVGEHRCECGNRRIYLDEVDKDFFVPAAD